jgi:hypothetical protein
MASHRKALYDLTRRLKWSFAVHHTDRPAEEAVLSLHNRLAGLETDYRYRAPSLAAPAEAAADEPS